MRAATSSHPELAGFWLWRAKIETFLGLADAARHSFERALEAERPERESLAEKVPSSRHPISAEIWSEWGRFLLSRGDSQVGAQALEKAVEFDPSLSMARLALIDHLLAAGHVDRARTSALDAIAMHVETPMLLERLERIRQVEPSTPQIVEQYRTALSKTSKNVVIMNNLATALTGLERFSESIEICRSAIQFMPDSPGIHATLAATLVAKGDAEGAIREFEILRGLVPESGDAAFKLGILYARVGRIADARRQFEDMSRIGTPQEREAAAQLLKELSIQP
ncbi:MAG: tetratricopeptide repeat protein [Planctomycetes bacterium]|nr:tetratricopeptide repeat protein [Planctomycetota bacterium]